MKIAHVLAYMSEDGSYGGPSTVARNQAAELARRGHEVTLFAAAPPNEAESSIKDGFQLSTFPAKFLHTSLGFAGLYSPGLASALRNNLHTFDAVHIHLARDLTTLPAARLCRLGGTPFVVQPHGMIDQSGKRLAHLADRLETRKALAAAHTVLTLTSDESESLKDLQPQSRIQRIKNGIEIADQPPYTGRGRGVVFLARLHRRKRPLAFVDMAKDLIGEGILQPFVLAGPDEGELGNIRARLKEVTNGRIEITGGLSAEDARALLRTAKVYVLPSVGEVFPMTLLEAFTAGTPVVATDSLGIAELCREYNAAVITNGQPEELARAVKSILDDSVFAEALRAGAQRLLESELNIESVARQLEDLYQDARVSLKRSSETTS